MSLVLISTSRRWKRQRRISYRRDTTRLSLKRKPLFLAENTSEGSVRDEVPASSREVKLKIFIFSSLLTEALASARALWVRGSSSRKVNRRVFASPGE